MKGEFMETSQDSTGLCQCGCGQRTKLSDRTIRSRGVVRGQPLSYINGHAATGKGKGVVYTVDPITGCWNVDGYISDTGYGNVSYKGKKRGAHVLEYEKKYGPVPGGKELDHTCRNRGCCNPDHVVPKTRAENVRCGAAAKLTWDQVHEIRSSPLGPRALGRIYGIGHDVIIRIKNNKAWIEDPE